MSRSQRNNGEPAFLVDAMLGTLVTYLRMCGYDTAYALERGLENDEDMLASLVEANRTVLTRDRELARRASDAILLTSTAIETQLRTLKQRGVDLTLDRPRRCSLCNGRLTQVREGPTPEYAPSLDEESVWQCRDCGQYFWMGSHWDDVADRLASL